MNYEMSEMFFKSSNGVNNIAYYNFKPFIKPRAVIQIVHGMNENTLKYAHFIDYMAGKGIAVVSHDHLGHGGSVENEDDYGFFAPSDGYKRLVDDMRTVTLKAAELYAGLPIVIFAHSMGTFVTRLYITEYAGESNYPNAVILSGTSGPVSAVTLGIAEASRIADKHGCRFRSKALDNGMREGFHKHPSIRLTAFGWLTRDEKVIERYLRNENAMFVFTASAFRDLFTMLKLISEQEWYMAVPKTLPIYLTAGGHDPVGQFGRGVTKVYNSLRDAGVNDVRLSIYPECRHELINELNRDEIFNDFYSFISDIL